MEKRSLGWKVAQAAGTLGVAALSSIMRKGTKSTTYKPKAASAKLKQKLQYNASRALTRQPKSELKCFDVSTTNMNPNNAVSLLALNLIVQGAEIYNRIGRCIYMKSLHVRGYFQAAASANQDVCRVLIVYDSQANKGSPGLADLLLDSNAGAANSGFSEINISNRERFTILKDKQFYLPSLNYAAGVETNVGHQETNKYQFNWFIKLKGLETMYNANAGALTDINSGSLLIFCQTLGTGGTYVMPVHTRLRYYD